jgi:cephalosporin-C deacetylase
MPDSRIVSRTEREKGVGTAHCPRHPAPAEHRQGETMDLLDKQRAALEAIEVPLTRPDDFDAFWQETLATCRSVPLDLQAQPVDYPISAMHVRDVTFAGIDGTAIEGWLAMPAGRGGKPLPLLVRYHGAGGSRGNPASLAPWVMMGAAVFTYSFRMQGGRTGSATGFTGSTKTGWMGMGVSGPRDWYHYFAVTDAVRAVEAAVGAVERAEAAPGKVCVEGGSQGGGMSLTVSAVLRERIALCLADVPSSCWIEKRIFDRSGGTGGHIADALRSQPARLDDVLRTVSYFDNVNLADRIAARVLVSVGLKDPVCPPECVYAACNRITAPKEIVTYPFAEHEGGRHFHEDRKLALFGEVMCSTGSPAAG